MSHEPSISRDLFAQPSHPAPAPLTTARLDAVIKAMREFEQMPRSNIKRKEKLFSITKQLSDACPPGLSTLDPNTELRGMIEQVEEEQATLRNKGTGPEQQAARPHFRTIILKNVCQRLEYLGGLASAKSTPATMASAFEADGMAHPSLRAFPKLRDEAAAILQMRYWGELIADIKAIHTPDYAEYAQKTREAIEKFRHKPTDLPTRNPHLAALMETAFAAPTPAQVKLLVEGLSGPYSVAQASYRGAVKADFKTDWAAIEKAQEANPGHLHDPRELSGRVLDVVYHSRWGQAALVVAEQLRDYEITLSDPTKFHAPEAAVDAGTARSQGRVRASHERLPMDFGRDGKG